MKITELIEQLQDQLAENGDLEVMTSSNYGDYHQTEQLDEIAEITTCTPVESAYSNTGLAFYQPEDEDEDEEFSDPEVQRRYEKTEKEPVLVLRYTNNYENR